jgi:anaerobic ribonucleoside-triphosphate reductase
VPAHTVDAAVADRFALIDLQTLPGPARSFVKTHPLTHDIVYTPGLQLNAAIDLSPIDRVRLEGQLHECVPTDALTHIHLPDTETSHRAIADSVRKTFHHTRNRRLLIWG